MDFVAWEQLPNFNKKEFACKCNDPACEKVPMDYDFMQQLQNLRTAIGMPFNITSGYRCPFYETRIGGSGKNHPYGKAVDISADNHTLSKIVVLADVYGFKGIGVKMKGTSRFIHLDTTHTNTTVWSY